MTAASTTGAEPDSISVESVRHLAELSRISLDDNEVEVLRGELNSILGNVAKVSEVVNAEVPATSHPLPIENVSRPDVIADQLTRDEALQNAPEEADGMFRVSSILGEEQ